MYYLKIDVDKRDSYIAVLDGDGEGHSRWTLHLLADERDVCD